MPDRCSGRWLDPVVLSLALVVPLANSFELLGQIFLHFVFEFLKFSFTVVNGEN
jgi:hypothetical protein